MKQALHWYHCLDVRGGEALTDPQLRDYLSDLHSRNTNQRLDKLPLAIGMPLMIVQYFDIPNGIFNGCTGTLASVRFTTDEYRNRHAHSCIIHTPDAAKNQLPNLPKHHAVTLEDISDLTFRHPDTNKKCKIRRTQLPVMSMFAMTAHKAQGQTMKAIITDLDSCSGTESPYVMLSRVRNLEDLAIFQPFSIKRITCRPSEDVRKEYNRLHLCDLQTMLTHGNENERAYVESAFSNLDHPPILNVPEPNKANDPSVMAVEVDTIQSQVYSVVSKQRKNPRKRTIEETSNITPTKWAKHALL